MNRREQAKLYYLYMMSDGEVSSNEKKLFNTICKELSLDADDKKQVIKECEKAGKEGLMCIEILKKNEKEEYSYTELSIDLNGYISEKDKTSILWNLVNLGYADSCFTNVEKEVVDYLCKYWEVEKSLHREMIDVAETILALEKKKAWVEEKFSESELKQTKIKQIKKDIKYVQETIKTTISEID